MTHMSPVTWSDPAKDISRRLRKRRNARGRRRLRFESLESRRLLASISGRLAYDMDGNSAPDLDERGLENWLVYIDQNSSGKYEEGEPFARTDAGGAYRIEGLSGGFHVLAQETQGGWQQSYPPGTGRWTVPLLATQDAIGYDFASQRHFTPLTKGNLLATRSSLSQEDFLLEYTPAGELVQAIPIPGSENASRVTAKDLVVDSRGKVQIFNGYDDVRLTTFDPAALVSYVESAAVQAGLESDTFARTQAQDTLYHRVTAAGGSIDLEYGFQVTNGRTPLSVTVRGRLDNGPFPAGDDAVEVYAWDWSSQAWQTITSRDGGFAGVTNGDASDDATGRFNLAARHVGAGADQGKVRIRLAGDSLENGAMLYVDLACLSLSDPATAFSTSADPVWDMGRSVDAWGDLAAFGNFLFANEHRDDSGPTDGVIRFNADGLTYQRFSSGLGVPTDITVGLDRYLYVLNAGSNNTTIQVRNPNTMELVRTVNVAERLRSLAVDAAGEMFAITDTGLKRFSPAGSLVASTVLAGGDDIAISADGRLVLAGNLRVDLTDPEFSSVQSFLLPGDAGANFTGFAAFVQEPVSGMPGGGVVDYGIFTPGNLLVSNSPAGGVPKLMEYTIFGQLVQEIDIPGFEFAGAPDPGARDLVVDATGNVYLYNGTFAPRLSTYDPHRVPTTGLPRGFTGHQTFPGWNTLNNPAFGGLAAYDEFVFATDTKTLDDTTGQRGIVRYNTQTGVFERFHSQLGDLIDVNVGLDGLLYVLGPANGPIGTTVYKFHPVTMQALGTISLAGNHRAIAVDANGDLFAVYPEVVRYDRFGGAVGAPLDVAGPGSLTDIDLDADGRLLIAAQDGRVLVTDRSFTGLYSFPTRVSDGFHFAAFVSPSRGVLRAAWDSFHVNEGSADNPLDVLANDVLAGLGAISIVAAGPASHGGTVTLTGGTLLQYTPAPGFVGVEQFTYTVTDGLGHTDQALVRVTVDGIGRFLAVDETYWTLEDEPLDVPGTLGWPGLLTNDGQPDIFPVLTPGNFLVTHSPVGTGASALLQEYDRNTGQLVRSMPLPDFSAGRLADVRDVVVDRAGRVQVFNGTTTPRLTTYDALTDTQTHQTVANWNTPVSPTGGGLAAWRNFVFATDRLVPPDTTSAHEGILRFDIEAGAVQRFPNDGDFIDLAVGLDGLLYGLGSGERTAGAQWVRVFRPDTMQFVREFRLNVPNPGLGLMSAITVDRNGQVYAVRYDDDVVYRFSTNGFLNGSYDTFLNVAGQAGEAKFSDIDIHENNRDLLIANINFSNSTNPNDCDVVLVTGFSARRLFQAPDATSDMKFVAWVQAPVGAINGPLTVSRYTQPGHGTLVGLADGSFDYTPAANFAGWDSFSYVVRDADGNQRQATASIAVTPVNDPPVLTPAAPAHDSDEDALYTTPLTQIVNGGPGTTTVTDADPDDALGGIAVIGLNGFGNWSYSLNGTIFNPIGVVNDDAALLLPYSSYLRFAPGGAGQASLTYRAWDASRGAPGTKFDTTLDVCPVGWPLPPDNLCPDGSVPLQELEDPFSLDLDVLSLTLADLNDAPVLIPQTPTIGQTTEELPLAAQIQSFITGGISDQDLPGIGLQGLAVVGAIGRGAWEYSLDGVLFLPLPAVSDSQALLLDPDDWVRYTPDGLNGETAAFLFRAWDRTDNAGAGSLVDASRPGGTSAYSAATDMARLLVTDVNDAPLLAPANPLIGATDVVHDLTATIKDFVVGVRDVDLKDTLLGIAVTGVAGAGTWSYSLDAGQSFTPVPAVSPAQALLLFNHHLLRYAPDRTTPETATVTYRAWDTSSGQAGQRADTSSPGGTAAFSVAQDTAAVTVKEVNDPPQLIPPTSTVTYTENDPPAAIFADAVISDPDSPDFLGGRLEVSLLSGGSTADRLAVQSAGGISLAGNNVLFDAGAGPELIGQLLIQGFNLTVSLTTDRATAAAAQALARAVTFANVSEAPSTVDRRVRLTLVDGDGGNEAAQVEQTVHVTAVNDPPVAVGEIYELLTTGSLTLTALQGVLINDTDLESDPLSARLVQTTQHGQLTLREDGSLTYQPDLLYYGLDTFTYQAFDGQDLSNIVAVGIQVRLPATNPSHPADVNGDGYLSPLDPLWAANWLAARGPQPLPADFSPPPFLDVTGDGSISEADVAAAAAAIDTGGSRPLPPPHLEFAQDIPDLGDAKFVQIRLQATDAGGQPMASVPAEEDFYLDVLVKDLRASPLGVFAAYLDIAYTAELVSVTGGVIAGAQFPNYLAGNTGAAGVVHEVGAGRISALPGSDEQRLVRIPMRAGARGEAVFVADPADDLPAGHVLLFGIDGPISAWNVEYLPLTLPVTGPPLAVDDQYQMIEDGTLDVAEAAGVLDNDQDDEGDPLRAVLVAGPQHGSLTLREDGSFVYAPAPDFFGTDYFTYRANDGRYNSAPATVTIDVLATPDDPLAVDDHYLGRVDTVLEIGSLLGVLANDDDPDGDQLTVTLAQQAQHGTVSLEVNGAFVYQPEEGFGGTDQFRYIAHDGTGRQSASTLVTINVLFDWQNPTHPVDVDGDGWSTPLDPLLLLNDQLRYGSRPLQVPPVPPNAPPPFLDVNGDGLASDFDVGLALQELNRLGSGLLPEPRLELPQTAPQLPSGKLIEIKLEITGQDGAVQSELGIGDTFFLNVYVRDLRPAGTGVFSAFVDVAYPNAAVELAGPIVFGTDFPNLRIGSTATAGLLDEVGAVAIAARSDALPRLLFRAPFYALAEGQVDLAADSADSLPAHPLTLIDINGAIPADRAEFLGTSVAIVVADEDGDGIPDRMEDGAPNQGDGNGDGIPDRKQGNVTSLLSPFSLKYVTLVAGAGRQLSGVQIMANPAPGSAPANVSFPLGFIGYQLAGMAAGGSEVLSVLSEPGVLWNTLYRFGATPGAEPPVLQPFLWDGKTGGRIFADEIAVGLIDGQRGDSDLAANGRIIDVLGPGFSPRPWQNPLLWPDVNNDGDVTPADVLALINEINAGRSGTLPLVPQGDRGLPPFWDVNGDGNLTANDVLDVINYLNARVGASESDEGGEGESLAATPVLPAADAPRSMPPAALVEIAVPARRLPAPATNLAAWPQAVDSALATLVRPAVTTAVPVAGSASPARSAPAGDASLALERALSEIADEIALLR